MATSSDEAVLQYYTTHVQVFEGFERLSPTACEAYVKKGDVSEYDLGELGDQLLDRDVQASVALLLSERSYTGERVEHTAVGDYFAPIVTYAQSSGFARDEFIRGLQFKLTPERNCQAYILFYSGILKLEPGYRTRVLRHLAQNH